MMAPWLVHFLRTGSLIPIRLGMTPLEIRAVLGDPDDTSGRSRRRPTLWRFRDLQLSFSGERLCVIALHFSEGRARIPAIIARSDEAVTLSETIQDMLAALKEHGISCEANARLTFGDQVCYRVGKTVDLVAERSSGRILTVQAS